MARIVVPGNGQVAFEKSNLDVYQRVGNLIYTASQSPDAYQDFQANTAARLIEAGVPPEAISEIKNFNVVKDADTELNVVVPQVMDRSQFGSDAEFNAYLVRIATVTLRACKKAVTAK